MIKTRNLLTKLFSTIKNAPKKILLFTGIGFVVLVSIIVTAVFFLKVPDNANYFIAQFESAGGSVVESQKVRNGDTVKEPGIPQKVGFDFIEWDYNGTKYDFTSRVKSNIVLTAKWESNHTTEICKVTFLSDGGSQIASIEVSKGYPITNPIPPTKDGYKFIGWFCDDGTPFDFSSPIKGDLSLVAKWDVSTTSNNSSGNISSVSGTGVQSSKNSNSAVNNASGIQNVQWSDIEGKWYLANSHDSYIVLCGNNDWSHYISNFNYDINNLEVVNKPWEAFGVLFPASDMNYSLKNLGIIKNSNSMTFNRSGKTATFYRQADYPIHTPTEDEILFSELKGTWYLSGTNNVTISFTEELKDGHSQYVMDLKNIEIYPTLTVALDLKSYNNPSYFSPSINAVKSALEFNHITFSNDTLTINKDGQSLTFVRTPGLGLVDKIVLDKASLTLLLGYNCSIQRDIFPSTATNKNIIWESSDTSVATVESYLSTYGLIHSVGIGTATITAKSADGACSATCTVTVVPVPVTGITLDKSSATVTIQKAGDMSYDLRATITPNNATNQDIIWKSSDTNIVTTNYFGFSAVGVGTATITATTVDGGFTASCTITVVPSDAETDSGGSVSN